MLAEKRRHDALEAEAEAAALGAAPPGGELSLGLALTRPDSAEMVHHEPCGNARVLAARAVLGVERRAHDEGAGVFFADAEKAGKGGGRVWRFRNG